MSVRIMDGSTPSGYIKMPQGAATARMKLPGERVRPRFGFTGLMDVGDAYSNRTSSM
jgi:hypothetical protein